MTSLRDRLLQPPTETTATALQVATPPAVGSLVTTIFGTDDPAQTVKEAARYAKAIADVVKSQGLSRKFGGDRPHVYAEAWSCLGSMLGMDTRIAWTKEIGDGQGFEACCVVSRGDRQWQAESDCTRDEPNWQNKPRFQLKSMAQTRAMSKALRMATGFIMTLAGYEATPAEEMTDRTEQTVPSDDAPPRCSHRVLMKKKTDKEGNPIWGAVHPIEKNPDGTVKTWCNERQPYAVTVETTATPAPDGDLTQAEFLKEWKASGLDRLRLQQVVGTGPDGKFLLSAWKKATGITFHDLLENEFAKAAKEAAIAQQDAAAETPASMHYPTTAEAKNRTLRGEPPLQELPQPSDADTIFDDAPDDEEILAP